MMNPINIPPKRGGGGLWGKIGGALGGAIGSVAGAFAGGPTGAMAGFSAGSSLGGAAGSMADPATAQASPGASILKTAAAKDPMVQLGLMQEARKDLKTQTGLSADEYSAMDGHLSKAITALSERMRRA